MPRQAHGRPVQPSKASRPPRPPNRKPMKNRRLNALEIAEEENPDQTRIPKHRLGQVEEDSEDGHKQAGADERSSKRRKISGENGNDSADEGSDLDGNRWHVGVDDEEEDSDIDSDDAFGDSDEEKFADFTFRGSATNGTKATRTKADRPRGGHGLDLGNSDASEASAGEDDSDEDDLGEDAVDLATVWDMNEEEENSGQDKRDKKRRRRATPETDEGSNNSSNYSESDGDGEDEDDDDDDDDADSQLSVSVGDEEGDHSRLQTFVEGLGSGAKPRDKKLKRSQQPLHDTPSAFGLAPSKISAADLLQYIKDPRQRQALKVMQSAAESSKDVYEGGIPGKLSAPLAKRQQDRLDRAAAYEQTKTELGKWIDTVKQNRRAEHLVFPLQDPDAIAATNNKQFAPTVASTPMNELESTIQSIMRESGMLSKESRSTEEQEQEYEELQEKKMPLEEVKARRAELRKARDLMFREEIRARRIKKIKSKSYRRVHRKEREREEAESRSLMAAQGLIDSDEEKERNDRRRAEVRMGARHRESKWASSVKSVGRAAWDQDVRDGMTDLARRDEELRRRIEGKAGAASGDSEFESDSDSEYESGNEVGRLERKLQALENGDPQTTESRLGAMAFMQKAEAARKAANDEELRNIRRGLHQDNIDESTGLEGSDSEVGRRRFGVKDKSIGTKHQTGQQQKSEFEERLSDFEEFDEPAQPQKPATTEERLATKTRPQATLHAKALNPTTSNSQDLPKSGSTLAVTKEKATGRGPSKSKSALKSVQSTTQLDVDDYTSPSGSEDGHDTDEKSALARAIFAGPEDHMVEFAKEKREAEEEEGDQIIDNTLPGWGSWTGAGVGKKQQKRGKGRFLTTVKGVAKDQRQDARLDRVIVNEKKVKKNNKYLANELPHPFESRQQYERSLRLPLGPEWTTNSDFQEATKPRVLVKQGVIKPMARPLA